MFNRIRSVRKRWLVVTAVVALLAVGLVSGAAFAANARADYAANALSYGYGDATDKGRHGHGNSTALMGRVAEILGVEQATLESAFVTAIDEQAETKFDTYVAGLVTDETITQEQADAATAWFEERPNAIRSRSPSAWLALPTPTRLTTSSPKWWRKKNLPRTNRML